jgi:hypothetical protein
VSDRSLVVRRFDLHGLPDDFFLGILAPAWRASLRATATACLRFVTFCPLPDFSVPSLYSCITFSTLPLPLVAVFLAITILPRIRSLARSIRFGEKRMLVPRVS